MRLTLFMEPSTVLHGSGLFQKISVVSLTISFELYTQQKWSGRASPPFCAHICAKKPNGKWRIVHAYNKLNAATTPAQTPISRKDVLMIVLIGCNRFSSLYLVDSPYQSLMQDSDIPVTAVSTPSGMIRDCLVMSQSLSGAVATYNRLVTQMLKAYRG